MLMAALNPELLKALEATLSGDNALREAAERSLTNVCVSAPSSRRRAADVSCLCVSVCACVCLCHSAAQCATSPAVVPLCRSLCGVPVPLPMTALLSSR